MQKQKKIKLTNGEAQVVEDQPVYPKKKKREVDQPAKKQLNEEEQAAKKKQSAVEEDIMNELRKDSQFLIAQKNSRLDKQTKVERMYTKIEGFIFKIALTKVGGRAIQLMLKSANESMKSDLYAKLLGNDHSFSELLKSNYGHYVGITMIRTMPNAYKTTFFTHLQKNLFQYMVHQQASQVLDRYIIKCVSPAQLNQLKNAIIEQANKQSELCENLAIRIIEKQLHCHILSLHLLNLALPVLVPVEREKVLAYFAELEMHPYLKTKEGVQLFCTLVNMSDSKIRKTLMKTLSLSVAEYLYETDSFFYVAVLKLLHSVDDTKLSYKFILKPLVEDLAALLEERRGYSVIASLFVEKHNELQQFESKATLPNQHSKKETTTRANELCVQIVPQLVNTLLAFDVSKLLRTINYTRFTASICKFIVQLILEGLVDQCPFLEHVVENLLVVEEDWILSHPDSQRLAKAIIILSVENSEEPFKTVIDNYVTQLTSVLLKHLKKTLSTKAVYLMITLLEQTNKSEQIVKHLKKHKPNASQCVNQSAFTLLTPYIT